MKPLKWWEPWALSRRRQWRSFVHLFFRSTLPRTYLICIVVGMSAMLGIMRLLEPSASIPLWRVVFALVHMPVAVLLVSPMFVLLPGQVIVHEKYVKIASSKRRIRPRQLTVWRVQDRKGYRRLALRYVDDWGKQRRQAYWLADSVDRADLERRMHDFAARGAAERDRGGNA
jgi:hypothetical protein